MATIFCLFPCFTSASVIPFLRSILGLRLSRKCPLYSWYWSWVPDKLGPEPLSPDLTAPGLTNFSEVSFGKHLPSGLLSAVKTLSACKVWGVWSSCSLTSPYPNRDLRQQFLVCLQSLKSHSGQSTLLCTKKRL